MLWWECTNFVPICNYIFTIFNEYVVQTNQLSYVCLYELADLNKYKNYSRKIWQEYDCIKSSTKDPNMSCIII